MNHLNPVRGLKRSWQAGLVERELHIELCLDWLEELVYVVEINIFSLRYIEIDEWNYNEEYGC